MVWYPALLVRSFLFAAPLLAWLLAAPGAAAAQDGPRRDDPSSPLRLELPEGKSCVQPTEWMRRNHMDFLKHNRDLAVREGVRVKDDSLRNCSTCHKSREKFCDRCHTYAGVAPNCFECHDYPK
ncbi:MAG: hypothetical protein H7837_01110 [Magnetococcus sp. MYC-9]